MKLSRSPLLLVLPAILSVCMLRAGVPPFQPSITAVDKDGITVMTSKKAPVTTTIDANGVKLPPANIKKFQVTKSTSITVNGLPGTLDDLKAGMIVQVTAGMDRNVAEKIVANTVADPLPTPVPGTNYVGSIGTRVLALTSDTITIAAPGGKASAYRIAPHVIIKVNGVVSPLAAVKVGMFVTVNSDGQTANRIVALDAR